MDGKFFTDTPQNLIAAGKVAKIPFISGVSLLTFLQLFALTFSGAQNVDDEGTVLALPSVNIT